MHPLIDRSHANKADDLFPTLDTPEAIAADEYYANLLKEFGPDGDHLPARPSDAGAQARAHQLHRRRPIALGATGRSGDQQDSSDSFARSLPLWAGNPGPSTQEA